ncbi:hypothetical protein GCM10010912_58310 [Paenibacillus albidus]|uniref:Peptidase S1 domain-containing protein n=1 Tax=Paenibacillus albidus TaxID=2041023 RepID=A0A917FV93_9BACL|nr:serine protease [Paenibacillus albidus]GGG05987.1 hypothetical protein GCM10010912_58310 [Paenibacillus albidus]
MMDELQKLNIEDLLNELRNREQQKMESEDLTVHSTTKINNAVNLLTTKELIDTATEKLEAIYDTDDRVDLFRVNDKNIIEQADSVVSLFKNENIVDLGNGFSELKIKTTGELYNFCRVEPFNDQPSGAFCTGFLVSSDIIATAGHCINESNLHEIRFIFGFRMLDEKTAQTQIRNSEIYKGIKIIGHQLENNGSDWALIKLNRKVNNHNPLQIRMNGIISNQEKLHVIGHPIGLPVKYAGNAKVKKNEDSSFFLGSLDTYGGNSGSPVFNSKGVVEGILVRGATDFVSLGTCTVSFVCSDQTCEGESCTRTTEFASFLE